MEPAGGAIDRTKPWGPRWLRTWFSSQAHTRSPPDSSFIRHPFVHPSISVHNNTTRIAFAFAYSCDRFARRLIMFHAFMILSYLSYPLVMLFLCLVLVSVPTYHISVFHLTFWTYWAVIQWKRMVRNIFEVIKLFKVICRLQENARRRMNDVIGRKEA